MKKLLTICLLSLSLVGCNNQRIDIESTETQNIPVETVNNSLPSDIVVIFEKKDVDILKTFIESKPEIFKNIKYEDDKLICEISEVNFEKAMDLLKEVKENAN